MKKVLEIAKKNLVSILCGVAALILLGLTYIYPLPSSYKALQEDVNRSKGIHDQLRAQKDQERYLPKLTIDDSPPPVLPGFPGPELVNTAKKAIDDLRRESEQLLLAATSNTGEIKPLTTDLFPRVSAGSEPLFLQYFRDQYWIATATDAVGFPHSVYAKILNGTLPPQQSEFESIMASRTAQILGKQKIGPDGKPINQDAANKEIAELKIELPRALKVVNAERGKIYVGPNSIAPHPQLGTQSATNIPSLDLVTAFNAQYSLWIQELILKAIADVNKDATNVLDAPIKHIVKLDIGAAYNFARPGPAATDPMASIDPPFNPSAVIPKDYRDDPFGHPAINELYELNTFDLTIRVDAARIPEILGSLTSGRFLFVNQVWVQSVDTGVALNEGYLYGPGPVAELRLRCNLLILRSQLTPWMPDSVKSYVRSRTAPALLPEG